MPILGPSGIGLGSGGGGLHFRNPPDEFLAASIAAARTARNTAFASGGTLASVLNMFAGDRSLAIILGVTGATARTFETYTGAVGAAYDATAWVERTDAVQGNPGTDGAQGRFEIIIHTNATTTPATPTGGTYSLSTGVLTPPTGWTEAPSAPGTGEDVYASQATIDPENQSGTVTPTWSAPVERSHLTSGISHVERTTDLTGDGTAADPLGAAISLARMLDLGGSPTQTSATFAYAAPTEYTAGGFIASGQFLQFGIGTVSSPDDSDVIVQIGTDTYTLTSLGGIPVKVHELVDDTDYLAFGKSEVLLLMGPTDGSGRIVDVTDSNLPTPDADALGKIFLNRSVPAAWMLHEVPHASTPVMGTFDSYVSPRDSGDDFDLYRGAHGSDPTTVRVGHTDQNVDSRHVGIFYYNWRDGGFRIWTSTYNQATSQFVYHWQAVHIPADRLVPDGTGIYLGHANTDADLLVHMPQDTIDSSRTYVGVATNNTGTGVIHVRVFDNSSYVAAVGTFNVYDFVTIGLYGTGGNAGQTAAQVVAAIQTAITNLNLGSSATEDLATTAELRADDAADADKVVSVAPFTTVVGELIDTDVDAAVALLRDGVDVGLDTLAKLATALLLRAPLASPNLTGTPTVPNSPDGDNTGMIANTRFVTNAISGFGSGGFTLRFGTGAPGSSLGSDGDWYINTTTGGFFEKTSGSWSVRYTDQVGAGGGLTQDQVDARVTALAALLTGAVFTGAVSGITPTADAHFTRKDYVDTEDALALKIAQNLSDLASVATARTNLGLGTAATEEVGTAQGDIPLLGTGGTLPIDRGGTQSSTVTGARNTLGILTQAEVDGRVTAGVLDEAEDGNTDAWGIAKGGTGATTASAARTALSVLNQAGVDDRVAAGVLNQAEDGNTSAWGIAKGGTGATTASAARTALSVLNQAGVDGRVSALAALLTGATFTGAVKGVTPVDATDFVIKSYVDGRTNAPTHTTDQYVAVKATNTFVAADFTGANGEAFASGSSTAIIPDTLSGSVYFALARLASDPDAIFLDVGNSGINQIGGLTDEVELTINGQTYNVRVSENSAEYGGSTVEYR